MSKRNKAGSLFHLARLYTAQFGRCFHCDGPMQQYPADKNHADGWTREHVVPIALGGRNWENIVLAHRKCNSKRGTTLLSSDQLAKAKAIMVAARKLKYPVVERIARGFWLTYPDAMARTRPRRISFSSAGFAR